MNDIKLFDSLIHVAENEIGYITNQMHENNIAGGFAVGMPSVEDYDERNYSQLILDNTDKLFPIAFYYYEPDEPISKIRENLKRIRGLKYVGIKLHPRTSKMDITDDTVATIIREANEHGLVVLFCTYFDSNIPPFNTVDMLAAMIYKLSGAKVILMHGGTVRLLDAVELARAFNNILLDLSLTLCKYPGSSLDMDLNFAFKHFDRRVCVGSDYPDFALKDLRNRFNFFAKDTLSEKVHNVAYKNIAAFTGLQIY